MELEKIPGYTRALARGARLEERAREFAFLGAHDKICGVEVRLLTFRMWLQLEHARSPFIVGGPIGIADVAIFLWRLSPAYDSAVAARASALEESSRYHIMPRSVLIRIARRNDIPLPFHGCPLPGSRKKLVTRLENNAVRIAESVFRNARARFCDSIVRLPFKPAKRAINRFLDRMLMDRPPSRVGGSPGDSTSDVVFASDLIHSLGTTYSLDPDRVLDLPVPEVYQLIRQIQREGLSARGKRLPTLNPIQARLTRRFRKRALAAAAAAPEEK